MVRLVFTTVEMRIRIHFTMMYRLLLERFLRISDACTHKANILYKTLYFVKPRMDVADKIYQTSIDNKKSRDGVLPFES